MPIRNSQPVPFIPVGLTDSRDGNNSPQGGMAFLQNLIPDTATPGLFSCRPASVSLTDFSGYLGATVSGVTAMHSIGTRVYGMVSMSSGALSGHDAPFCYETATSSFIAITGMLAANTPTTQATTGAWTPPTMDTISVKIIVTHPGFPGTVGKFFGVIDITNPAAPTWAAANTATNALPSVPTAVIQFANRAYFACANVLWYSDVLVPTTISNATNSLTLGDTANISALGVTSYTQTVGGILQSLIGFKEDQCWQVTGDLATSDLALNELSDMIGTLVPRSIIVTTLGTLFCAADGIRAISGGGQISDPLGGFTNVFQNISVPSRGAATYTNGVYRICIQTSGFGALGYTDFWFDTVRKIWTGPHSFIYECAVALGGYTIIAGPRIAPNLWKSGVILDTTDTFTENGTALTWLYQSITFPEPFPMTQKYLSETTLSMQLTNTTQPMTFAMLDQSGSPLGVYSAQPPGYIPTGVSSYNLHWPMPIVFNRAAFEAMGSSSLNFRIGDLFMRIAPLGYIDQDPVLLTPVAVAGIDWGLVTEGVTSSQDYGSVTDLFLSSTADWGYVQ